MTSVAGRLRLSLGQLRWKLTASYTAVTVAALLVVVLVLLAAGIFYWRANAAATPRLLLQDLEAGYAPLIRPYLADRPPDVEGLRTFLAQFEINPVGPRPFRIGNLQISGNMGHVSGVIFFDSDGRVVTSLPHSFVAEGATLADVTETGLAELAEPLQAALTGARDSQRLVKQLQDRTWVGALPVFASDDSDRTVGALAFITDPAPWLVQDLLKQIGLVLLFVTFLAAVMGTLFGSLTARGLDQRLQAITSAISGWSQGQFSVSVQDSAGDELASLAGDLNHMANQLAHLVDRRQEMSIMEERNRLARDLHDSAKQQAFAASAQLAAARARLPLDRTAALAHVVEAEALVDQVRQELTTLIQELRPTLLQEIGLIPALRQYAFDWAELNGYQLGFTVDGDRVLPIDVREALFRIVQEALANVARHSEATQVMLAIRFRHEQVLISIQDNGCGFDVDLKARGVGLCSMHERAELVGGRVSINSESGAGTTVEVTVPIPKVGGAHDNPYYRPDR